MDPAVILAENLTKKFERGRHRAGAGDAGSVAIQGLNLAVTRGEIFGLVGPDGAGKTTILRIFTGILSPSEGRSIVLGYDTTTQAGIIRSHIGYMAQRFNLYGELTVRENLEFFADIFGVKGSKRRERLARLLAFARLEKFQDRHAAHLSGGMQKKLSLAATLIHEPKVLFLDEPTTGVDPISRREFWEILTDLHLQGITILVSTPYMDEAERCSRVAFLYKGRLIVCDTPERIKHRLPGDLIEVRPDLGRWTGPGLHQTRLMVGKLEGVLEIQTYGNLLHIFVDRGELRLPQVVTALKAAGVTVADARQIRPRMEEAFISLIQKAETSGT